MAGRQRGFKLFGVFISEEDEVVPMGADLTLSPPGQQEGEEDTKKKPKRVTLAAPLPQQLPWQYRDLVESIGGEKLRLIMGKRVTATDLGRIQNRLSLPQGQIMKSNQFFLTPEEEVLVSKKISAGKQTRHVGVDVRVIDPSMKERAMNLARWNEDGGDKEGDAAGKKKSWWMALKKDWVNIAAQNGLQEGDAIQIWAFRFKADGSLGFVIHKVQPPLPPPPPAAKPTLGRRRRPRTEDKDDDNSKPSKKTNTRANALDLSLRL